jgi:hypothetical protein
MTPFPTPFPEAIRILSANHAMILRTLITCFTLSFILVGTNFAVSPELETKVKSLLLEIDFSGDGQRDQKTIAARAELNALSKSEVSDALVALHVKSKEVSSSAGEAVRSSFLRAATIRQLELLDGGAVRAVELARGDLDGIKRVLLARKESDDLHVAPFEIESVMRVLVHHGTSEDIDRINQAAKALSSHNTTLSAIWAQSIQSDLGMLQKEKSQNTSATKAYPTATTRSTISLSPTKAKSSEAAKLAVASEEPTSTTPWSIIVVLIVAATGLLWLLLKKRK